MKLVDELREFIESRLLMARRVKPSNDYTRGYKEGSVAELEEVEEWLQDLDD